MENQEKALVTEYVKEIELPSGKKAQFIKGKGKHLREAQKLANGEQSYMLFALASQLVRIDGNKIVMEDFDEMDLKDVGVITGEVGEYLA